MQCGGATGLAQHGGHVLLNKIGLAFFDQQDRSLALAKPQNLRIHHRISHVHDVDGHTAAAIHIGQAQAFEHPHQGVVVAALHQDAHIIGVAVKELVELVLLDECNSGWPALGELFLLVHKTRWRQHNAADIAPGLFHGLVQSVWRAHIVTGGEAAMHMASADAQLQHHRGMAGL